MNMTLLAILGLILGFALGLLTEKWSGRDNLQNRAWFSQGKAFEVEK